MRKLLLVLLLAVALALLPMGALAGTAMGDFDHFCYYTQVWHGTYQHSDRSDRYATSRELSYPYNWRLFYQAYGYHNWFGYEWWSHDFDYSCLSNRGYQ